MLRRLHAFDPILALIGWGIRPSCALFLVAGSVSSFALAQIPQEFTSRSPAPTVRIVGPVDESQLTVLRGSKHPLAIPENDRGSVSSDQPLRRMLMLLRRSAEQEAALGNLLAAQLDPNSPLFHKWLTPEQYGLWFGPSDHDVQTITAWLSSQGFTGIALSNGRTVVKFSGSAGQVQSAFHTAIHRYLVSGAMHFANQTDPSIPTALVPAIEGIVSLNDFGYRPQVIRGPTLDYTKGQPRLQVVPGAAPDFTFPEPNYYTNFYGVAPYDFATIYDLLPLWNAGLDGTGQTIAIVGETDINLNDPEQFRAFFGLPVNDPTVTISGVDPGVQPDETESDLDVEWSGAIAKGAQIELVSSATTETTAGVDLSALYIVDNNLAPVMSESYSDCELFLGPAGNSFEAEMWRQASAEGITVLVSSGDEGSSECDPTTKEQRAAEHPMAVSGLASTPYNMAVGGSDFNQYNAWSTYWSASNDPTTKQSVLGYIPEIPWNDSCASTTLEAIYGEDPAAGCSSDPLDVSNLNTIATGGGPSSCVGSDGSDPSTCTGGWPKPLWQSGNGVPSDGVRDIPDVALFASNGVYDSAYIVCQVDASGGSGCDPTASTQTFLAVGGTSASTPAMAGVMAIINQKYGRQGNANPTLYRLAASAVAPSIFHDITTDGNRVACESPDPDCLLPPATSPFPFGETKGHDSTVGYDMVTGLGTIDIANLVNNWSTVAFTPTTTTLTLNGGTGTVSAVHSTPIEALAGVTATTSGNPTGDVSIIGTQPNSSVLLGALNAGSVSGAVDSLPGGTYTVTARYAGDIQFAPSESAPVSVNISAEPSVTKLSVLNYNPSSNTFAPSAGPLPYGSLLLIRSDISGQSGHGVATGSVTLSDSGTSLGQFALNAQSFTEYIPNNLLLAGAHSLSASYPGDTSFNSSVGTAGIALSPAQMACALQANTSVLRPGWTLTLIPSASLYQKTLAPPLGNMVAPTGTLTIYSGSTAAFGPVTGAGGGGGIISTSGGQTLFSLPTISLGWQTLQISQLTSVTAPITVSYSGDSNYASCTSIPLLLTYDTSPLASWVAGQISPQENILAGTPTYINIQVGPQIAPPVSEPDYPAPTGTLQLSVDGGNVGAPVPLTTANGVSGPIGNANYGEATLTVPTASLSSGMHEATVTYGGDVNYLPGIGPTLEFWIIVPDFSVSMNPQALTVTNGQTTGPSTITISPSNGFTGIVSFSCSGLPQGAACVFSPSTVTASGATSLTITTTKAQEQGTIVIAQTASHRMKWLVGAGAIACGFLFVAIAPRRRRKAFGLCAVATLGLTFGIMSCGGGSGGGGSPPPINPRATSTGLTATTTTPPIGMNDTFTAGVATGSGTPLTGSVQFSVDGANSGSPVALGAGATAQFVTSFAIAGPHSVVAAYSGNATNDSSTSSPLQITVPNISGSAPGIYPVTITAASGTLSHTTTLTLTVQ